MLAWAREGYRHTDVNLRDMWEWLNYRGFWRMAAQHWRMGFEEMWRSFSKPAFVRALQRLIPEIRGEQLDWAPGGVRAQAVSPEGTIIDDWIIDETDRVVNVQNAPSPAATASLNIGRLVVDRWHRGFEPQKNVVARSSRPAGALARPDILPATNRMRCTDKKGPCSPEQEPPFWLTEILRLCS